MADSKILVAIPWKERLLRQVGFFPVLGGNCYVVLSEQFFGWRPCVVPFFFPRHFSVIRTTALKSAGFKGNWIDKSVYMTTDLEDPTLKVIEGQIGYPHAWLTAFDVLGIPVENRQLASLKTVKGFLATYQDFVWFLAIGLSFLLCFIVAVRMEFHVALTIVVFAAPIALWYLSLLARMLIKKFVAGRELKDKSNLG
jgi:hypothetical protein